MRELMGAKKGERLSVRSNSNRPDGLLRMTDPRVEAIYLKRLEAMASFPNKFKDGLELGDIRRWWWGKW